MPEVSVFFMDTELRMKDKIVPLFEEELARRHAASTRIIRMERELFEIREDASKSAKLFIINANDSIMVNIEAVLSRYFRTGCGG
jgi:hypothetical protein